MSMTAHMILSLAISRTASESIAKDSCCWMWRGKRVGTKTTAENERLIQNQALGLTGKDARQLNVGYTCE